MSLRFPRLFLCDGNFFLTNQICSLLFKPLPQQPIANKFVAEPQLESGSLCPAFDSLHLVDSAGCASVDRGHTDSPTSSAAPSDAGSMPSTDTNQTKINIPAHLGRWRLSVGIISFFPSPSSAADYFVGWTNVVSNYVSRVHLSHWKWILIAWPVLVYAWFKLNNCHAYENQLANSQTHEFYLQESWNYHCFAFQFINELTCWCWLKWSGILSLVVETTLVRP